MLGPWVGRIHPKSIKCEGMTAELAKVKGLVKTGNVSKLKGGGHNTLEIRGIQPRKSHDKHPKISLWIADSF